ncbi:MAG TPA: DUF4159 domain-containing protein [Longimicrobiales bacterium]|nr:DUF4159 domain-containing protein [Longimicrobiales bacterium]
MRRIALAALTAAAFVAPAHDAAAQFFGGRSYSRVRLGDGLPDIGRGFTYCRLAFRSVRDDGSGNGWTTDYPDAERNLLTRLEQLTTMHASRWSHGEMGYAIVRPTDPEMYSCPMVMATDVGELGFSPDEAEAMRDYLLKGGFFWADDFWGNGGWAQLTSELHRVLPEYSIVELPPGHPIYTSLYIIPEIPQIPSMNSWRRTGRTSELGAESARPSMSAITDESGRILVLITHNTDISDGWERENYDDDYFYEFSPEAYAVVINVLLWTMSH